MSFGDVIRASAQSVDGSQVISLGLSGSASPNNLMVVVWAGNTTRTPTPAWNPTSFTFAQRDQATLHRTAVWWKITQGNEPSTFQIDQGGAGDQALAVIELEGPIAARATPQEDGLNGAQGTTTAPFESLTTTQPALVVAAAAFGGNDNDVNVWSDSLVERIQTPRSPERWFGIAFATRLVGAGTITPTATLAIAQANSNFIGGWYQGVTGDAHARIVGGVLTGALTDG